MVFPIFIIIGLLTQVLCQDSALNSSDGIVIHQVEVQTSSIGRIKYEDGEVILYQNQRKPTDIFFTPFPRVNPVNSECNENILSGHIELSLSVELYTSLLIQVIQSYMKQYFPKLCNENSTCDASLLPMSAIRLVQKGLRTDKSRQMYTINDEWRSNTLLLQSIEFVIYTMNQSVCEQLRSSIVKQCYLSNFEIHYSLHSEKTVERQVEINTEQITGTSMYNRILSQFPRSDTIALSGGDFKQLISEVSDKITMKLRVQEGFDSQLQDPIALDKVLERQLQLKQVHLEKADDQLWNSLYWTQDLTRPDRLAKAINTIVRKDSTDSNHFLYDSQAAKNIHKLGLTQHDIDRLEQFDKLLATHAHKKSSSGSGTSHSGGGGSLHVFGRFKIGGSGSSSSQSQSHQFEDDQKVTDSIHDKKNHSNHLNVTNIESNNDTQYVFSRDQVEKYLSELSDHIHLEGEIILPKPINAHILKLSTLRSETKLLSHTVLVRTRSNVHVLPLRCPSKETKASTSNTMNQYRWLDDKVEQLKTTIEKLTNKLSELNNQMSERITQVQQQCTNQVSEVQKKWMNKVNTSLQCENNIIAIKNTMSQEYKKLKKQITSIQQMAIRETNNSANNNKSIQTLSQQIELLEKKAMKKIVKKQLAIPGLEKIQLHATQLIHSFSLFNYLPINEDIKAILLSAMVTHGNHPQHHAYLGFDAYQENCDAGQKTTYLQHTFDAHGTIHRQELIVPWNNRENSRSTNLIINITNSYNTGNYPNHGNINYFQIELVGYII